MCDNPSYEALKSKVAELEQQNRELRSKAIRLQTLFDVSSDAIFLTAPHGQVLHANPAACELFQMTEGELISGGRALMYADGDAQLAQAVAERETTGKFRGILTHRKKDGSLFPAEVASVIFKDQNGDQRACTIIRDMTKWHEQRKDLQRAIEKYKTLFHAFPLGITVSNEQGRIIETNAIAEQLLGLGKDEHEGRNLDSQEWRIIRPDGSDMPPNEWASIIALNENQTVRNCEMGIVKSDNTVTWLNVTAAPLPIEGHGVVVTYNDITERKNAEAALKCSEERYRFLAENAGDVIFTLDMDLNYTYISPSVRILRGYEPSEVIGQAIDQVLTPKSLLIATQVVSEELEQKKQTDSNFRVTKNIELEMIRKDGSTVWTEVKATLLRDEKGNPSGILGVTRDISARKKAEDALRLSEERYRMLFEHSPLGVFQTDENGIIVSGNDNFVKIIGSSRDKLVGLDMFTLPDKKMVGEMQKALQGDLGFYEDVYRSVTAHKETPVKVHYAPISLTSGKIVGCVGIIEDITGQKEYENKLLVKENIIRCSSIAIATCNLEGMMTYANPVFYKWWDFKSPDECIGQHFTKFWILGEKYEDVMKALEVENIWTGEIKAKRKDGSLFDVQVSASTVFDDKGNPVAMTSSTIDITDQKQAEEERKRLQAQLIQSQKIESTGRLAGGVAHHFNNMLGVILGHAEMALDGMAPDNPLHFNVLEIFNAAQRSADITRQLLTFARKQIITPKAINLNTKVEEMLKMLRRLIGEDINLVWLPGENLGIVKVDPSQIDQLLVKLCANARDAIEGKGKITIKTDNVAFDEALCAEHIGCAPGEYILLAISDNGCGMDELTRDNLFEPFFSTKDVGSGTGLGLSAIYGIIKQNGGFITVYSELGQGTTFNIYLPRHEIITGPPQKRRNQALPAARENETILLVEDERAILNMTRQMLEQFGYKVLEASTSDEALRLAEEYTGEIHLFMTDLVMPEMNGLELTKRLMGLYPNGKCLYMSGYTANIIERHGGLADGLNFLPKPFTRKNLAEKIRAVLDANG
ncbi:PAS domain S-box protein [Desulfatibacillum aliphaticivorans]|uniref:PAS domain S-box protein n=1 Tax=Desulfatibacillum aliphaticivorans TaxID=218208 RepID=UPI00040C272A|nr:PAS domain S-box protein [Desulfatibacillum aliphaticivorans]